ncbi:DNA polymerase III subunit chi [Geoalkalibacter sp.]|jgi:DNA polymerase-3 subunit chi|uniref:DNA polymerase III subunit chi n=1 Tax=Geoalkalibacter sp. TaxID=3041440 RepID=UPI00272E157E|nr:DNA polymerase III subunit chi [Geoalkalibacter sp.]
MPRPLIEFIKLKKPEKARYLCELAEEFFQQGKRVLITVNDDNQGVTLDLFLWTWHKGSFLPHCFDNGAVDCLDEPVVITTAERNGNGARVLIQGKPCSLEFVRGFDQVIDFAESYDEMLLQQSRRRFVLYREAGFAPRMR